MNILFIGNSYTYYNDMPALFEQLAISNQKDVTVYSVTKGGRKLLDYTAADETSIALDTLLAEHTFDVCFIQEQSVLPAANYNDFISGLDYVVNKVRDRVDQLFLYATWGRKYGSSTLAEYNWTTETMTHLLSNAYQKAAKLHGACSSPVGNNFLYITQKHPKINLYHEDGSHPSYLGSCLVALSHYYTVFRDFPKDTEMLTLSDAERSAFRAAVCR